MAIKGDKVYTKENCFIENDLKYWSVEFETNGVAHENWECCKLPAKYEKKVKQLKLELL